MAKRPTKSGGHTDLFADVLSTMAYLGLDVEEKAGGQFYFFEYMKQTYTLLPPEPKDPARPFALRIMLTGIYETEDATRPLALHAATTVNNGLRYAKLIIDPEGEVTAYYERAYNDGEDFESILQHMLYVLYKASRSFTHVLLGYVA